MTPFATDFLTASPESHAALEEAVHLALAALREAWPATGYAGKTPDALAELFTADPLPQSPRPAADVFSQVKILIANSVAVSSPKVVAHFHVPPLIASIAAEIILTALNQSMDSFDQAPAATMLELRLSKWLCAEAGLPATAAATFTTGGSQSNYMALLLARDACLHKNFLWRTRERGLPPEAARLRILCSEPAHFTVEKSAAQLGLGTDAVLRIAADTESRMSIPGLENCLIALHQQNLIPMAIVATAGTTDFASIDPIPKILPLARKYGAWLHIDAAYGGAFLFSPRHRHLLDGADHADSFSLDFHKLLWQPISCAALLLRDSANFRFIESHSDYLNPESDDATPNLVTHSVMTTRRFDALKLWISFQILGREKLAQMLDRTVDLARHAASAIRSSKRLRLLHEPALGCLVFQYIPDNPADTNRLNSQIRDTLLYSGKAVIGRTKIRDHQFLKLSLMNPTATPEQLDALVREIEQVGRQIESQL